jgi:hypothetical protein
MSPLKDFTAPAISSTHQRQCAGAGAGHLQHLQACPRSSVPALSLSKVQARYLSRRRAASSAATILRGGKSVAQLAFLVASPGVHCSVSRAAHGMGVACQPEDQNKKTAQNYYQSDRRAKQMAFTLANPVFNKADG